MKRGALIAIVAGAAALVVAGGVAWFAASRPDGPEAAAQSFLDALAAGDEHAAANLVAESAPDPIVDAYDGAEALVENPQVVRVERAGGGSAVARARFDLGGTAHETSFGLVETSQGWKVAADALGELTATTTIGDSVLVGGVLAPADQPAALLPAVYPVEAAPAGLLEGRSTAAVLPGESATAAIEASLSADASTAAQEELDAYADACAVDASAVPAHCGLRVPWGADLAVLARIAFRIEARPVVALSDDGRSFAATGGAIVATAYGTTRDGVSAGFSYRADDWSLRGDVTFAGDEMVLTVE